VEALDPAAGTGGLAFLSAPMPRDVTLLGLPTVEVRMSLDRLGGNLAATWYDVGPDGKWTEWDHGSRELMHRDSRDQGAPVTPMAPFTTTLNLYPTETTLAAGHRLGLALSPELPAWIEPSPLAAGGSYAIMLGPQGTRLHVMAEPADAATLRAAVAGGV
jgi:predicted acyl esterase